MTSCRRCDEAETLPHVLCHCSIHSAAIQLRHDVVLHRLWKATRLLGVVWVNQRVEGDELRALRPDLVIRHEPSKVSSSAMSRCPSETVGPLSRKIAITRSWWRCFSGDIVSSWRSSSSALSAIKMQRWCNALSRLGYFSLIAKHLHGACVWHLPGSFPSLWGCSRGTAESGSTLVRRREM